jgi:hypothetical protein
MKLEITKEWFERRAARESDHEIGAGASGPPKGPTDGQDTENQGASADPTAPTEVKDE